MKINYEFLRAFPFFEELEPHDLNMLVPLFIVRKYRKGQTIFLEGGDGDELYIIESGVVKIYREYEAREIILAIFSEGDFFGEMAVLENKQARSASAQTVEATTLYVLKRSDFMELTRRNPQMMYRMMETALSRLRKANEMITDLTVQDAKRRVARSLLRIAETHGQTSEDGIGLGLRLTHQQLADMTGTVRETVTKVLLDLQSRQFINVEKRHITISQPQELHAWANHQND